MLLDNKIQKCLKGCLSKSKKSILYKENKHLYKIFADTSFLEEKERNIEYMINNNIPNVPKYYGKIKNIGGKIIGFKMEYIDNSYTFREAINYDIPIENKINAINDIYKAIETLHKANIYIGDIHLDNILIKDGETGYIIDLDEVRFPGDEWKFRQKYVIKKTNESYKTVIPNKYTDNIKLMISSLSLLLNEDLENFIDKKGHYINLELLQKYIKDLPDNDLNKFLKSKVPEFLKQADEIYFESILNEFEYKEKTKRLVKKNVT